MEQMEHSNNMDEDPPLFNYDIEDNDERIIELGVPAGSFNSFQ